MEVVITRSRSVGGVPHSARMVDKVGADSWFFFGLYIALAGGIQGSVLV